MVGPCLSCVSVEISPANPDLAPGARIQFAATVSNISNSAVVWSATAGSITKDGLFTAPSAVRTGPVTVTARSLIRPSMRANATVTITNATLAIATTTVPDATVRSPYAASFIATGGLLPYRWSLASGSLPAGLQLSPQSGEISGLPAQSGTFPLSIHVTDVAGHTAQKSMALLVSHSVVQCGPPAYLCSRTDRKPSQLPSSAPDIGSLLGANTVATDPDFGNRIARITDSGTDPDLPWQMRSFVSTSSGSADENLWNTDSTLFVLQNVGGGAYPFQFDPATLQATRLYASGYPSTRGLRLSEGGTWSRVSPNVFYAYVGTAIQKYDFSDRTNAPSPQLVFDFTSSSHCLPAGFNATWQSRAGISFGDAVFAIGYSNRGDQGTGVNVVAYKAGSGCSTLNTQTGQVTGDWGTSGTISLRDRWTIHNVKLSKDGLWLVIAPHRCTSGACSKGPYFWLIGTTTVFSCGEGGRCGGHWTEGFSHWVNNDNSPVGTQIMRPFSEPVDTRDLSGVLPMGLSSPLDQHQSWNNTDATDSLPFFSTTYSPTSPFPAPWYNEIIGVAPTGGGTVWRFAHSFITSQSQDFSTRYGIGSVSQDGRFFIFSSDWMGSLGSTSGKDRCAVGRDCRGDVFVVELN